MPTKGTLYENFVRSATFIAKSPSSLSFVHISINAPKFECLLSIAEFITTECECEWDNCPLWAYRMRMSYETN